MKKLHFNLSASTINNFSTCPWAFKLDKIDKRQVIRLPSVHLVFGQALHKLLQKFYNTGRFSNTKTLFENWPKFFDIETKQQQAEQLELKYSKATGFTMIKNWVAMAKEHDWLHEVYLFNDGKKGIELEFLLPYNNKRFEINMHGFMDLVIESHGCLNILDWKTGKHDVEKYRMQGLIYSWALYKRYGLVEEKVRFVHPSKKENKIIDIVVKDEDYMIVSNEVEKMFDAIENNKFEKNRGDHCKYCNWVDCENNINESLKSFLKKDR